MPPSMAPMGRKVFLLVCTCAMYPDNTGTIMSEVRTSNACVQVYQPMLGTY